MPQKKPFDRNAADIDPEKIRAENPYGIGADIVHHLLLKGFCLVGASHDNAKLDAARAEVDEVFRNDLLRPPPVEIVDGLLGEQGSSSSAFLSGPLAPKEEQTGGPCIAELDGYLQQTSLSLSNFDRRLGFESCGRSGLLLIQGGDDWGFETKLVEAECESWLRLFRGARILVLYFLGPGEASMELTPIGADEDTEPVEVITKPGCTLFIRCDCLSHKHYPLTNNYSLAFWILALGEVQETPVLNSLNSWANRQFQVLKDLELEDTAALQDRDIPREWMRELHHRYRGPSTAAIRGLAAHQPGTHTGVEFIRCLLPGSDFITRVPYDRWNHDLYYDADPDCWRASTAATDGHYMITRTCVQHAGFIDGLGLFDNKLFQISPMEAKGMDPQQRHILETCYEALNHAGMRKKDVLGKYVGIITGSCHPEWAFVEHERGGAFDSGQALMANRISFILGAMGPSCAIDLEMASSSMVTQMAAEMVVPKTLRWKESGGNSIASVANGVYMNFTPALWPRMGRLMNPIGRTMTFDESGLGYVRGEGIGSLCVRASSEQIDGVTLTSEDHAEGYLVGWFSSNNGRRAGLAAPCGPAQIETICESLRLAGCADVDVDAMECHGEGSVLADSVEAWSVEKALRSGARGKEEPLMLGAVKTQVGAQCEAAGMAQIFKAILSMQQSSTAPTLHLKVINPQLDFSESGLLFTNEALKFHYQSAFHGILARGHGGTNVHLLAWGAHRHEEDSGDSQVAQTHERSIAYWPSGGGQLDLECVAETGYSIIGSWTQWERLEAMHHTGDGVWTFTVILGANNFETFQIFMDGDYEKALHPGKSKAEAGTPVYGPSKPDWNSSWLIDGRSSWNAFEAQQANGAESGSADGLAWFEVGSRDKGAPGQQYQVKLLISGKYRVVTWDKVEQVQIEDRTTATCIEGKYYITGSFNDWDLQEMSRGDKPGHFIAEVGPLKEAGGQFQIVRNKDWEQVFYPSDGGFSIWGPDDQGYGYNWCLNGTVGNMFRVHFERTWEDGEDMRSISWTDVESGAQAKLPEPGPDCNS